MNPELKCISDLCGSGVQVCSGYEEVVCPLFLVHECSEPQPLAQSLDGSLVSRELADGSLELLLVSLQILKTLGLHLLQLLLSALVQSHVFTHVWVKAEVRVRREQSVQHSVHF